MIGSKPSRLVIMRHDNQDLFLDQMQKTFCFTAFTQTLRHHLFFKLQLNHLRFRRVGEMAARFLMAIFMAKMKKMAGAVSIL